MRNRGGRGVILPLLVVLFTSVVLVVGGRVGSVAAAEAGAARPLASTPGAGGAAGAPAASGASPGADGRVSTPASGDGPPADGAAGAPPAANTPVAAPTATSPAPPAEMPAPVERRLVPSLSHDLQFGIAVMPGGGYRIVFPYKENLDCGDANNNMARVCTSRSPFFIDLQPSFGVSESWDVLLDVRLSFEENVFRHHEVFLMPGFRYWLDTQTHVKFYTTLQLAFDRTRQSTSTVSSSDVGVRNSNGLMVEIMRNFGAYFQFGETVGFVRWLSFGVDAGIGVQARMP
jgi:hypothetical protein